VVLMAGDLFGLLGLGGFERRQPIATPSPLEIGKVYTCGPSVLTGDRSYSRSVWECIGFNRLHASMKWAGGGTMGPYTDITRPILISRLECEFDEAPADFVSAGGQA